MKNIIVTFLILCLVLPTRTVYGQKQKLSNRADTVCTLTEDFQKLVYNRNMLVMQRTALLERVKKLQEDNSNLDLAITSAEKQLNAMVEADSIQARMYESLQADSQTWAKIEENNEAEILSLQVQLKEKDKELKKQRRKTTWTAITGTAVSAALLYLYITK